MKTNSFQNLTRQKPHAIFYFLFSRFSLVILFSIFYFLFSVVSVLAAELFFEPQTQELGVGQEFQVGIVLNTEGEEINAIEGQIFFSSEFLELKQIRDGNSVVIFWIERPRVESGGAIAFSGIAPGGYKGDKGLLLSLVFRAKQEGQEVIEFQNAKTLLNDGEGSEASLVISNFQFNIKKAGPVEKIQLPETRDIERPESFAPEITSDPNIFNGKYFLVFATQDKNSSISYYEIKEIKQRFLRIFAKWVIAESPYVLRDQKLESYVFVKAVDKSGNVRIEKIPPQNPLRWYENYENLIIILLVIIVIFLLFRSRASQITSGGTRKEL